MLEVRREVRKGLNNVAVASGTLLFSFVALFAQFNIIALLRRYGFNPPYWLVKIIAFLTTVLAIYTYMRSHGYPIPWWLAAIIRNMRGLIMA